MATAVARKTETEALPEERVIEVDTAQVQEDSAGICWRNIMVRMPEGAVQDDLRNPAIWKRVQASRLHALVKLDHLFILAFDESWFAEATVCHATGTDAQLVIRKVGSFRDADEVLFSDDIYEVHWTGGGYGVRRKRDGVAMGNHSFHTVGLAADYLRSLYPKEVRQ